MPLRNTIYVPVFDKNLSVFVSGVLERRRSAKNEQISHGDISTCSQCRGLSVRQRICYDNKICFAVITSIGRAFFVSKPKRSKSQQPGACAFKGEVHKLTLSAVTLTKVSAKQFFADRPPASIELLCRAAETDPEAASLL